MVGYCPLRPVRALRWRIFAVEGGPGVGIRLHMGLTFFGLWPSNLARSKTLVLLTIEKLGKSFLQALCGSRSWPQHLNRPIASKKRRVNDLLRIKGLALSVAGRSRNRGGAEGHFAQVLDWARRQGTLSSEPRAAKEPRSTLAEPQLRPRKLFGSAYGRFAEGFETANLLAEETLLDGWYNRARWSGYARVNAVMTASVVKIACAKVGALILWAARIAPRLYAAVASETNVT